MDNLKPDAFYDSSQGCAGFIVFRTGTLAFGKEEQL
jgi:hypothetical protein